MNTLAAHRRAFTLVEMLVVLTVVGLLAAILLPVVSRARASARTSTCVSNLHRTGLALNLYTADNDGFYPPVITLKPSTFTNPPRLKLGSIWWMNLKMQTPPVCPDLDLSWQADNPTVSFQLNGYASNYNLTNNSGSRLRPQLSGRSDFVLQHPSFTVIVFDARPLIYGLREPDNLQTRKDMRRAARAENFDGRILQLSPGALRHQSGANYLFADGHVKWMKPEQLSTTRQNDGVHPGFGL